MTVLDYVLLGRTTHLPPLGGESPEDVELAEAVIAGLDLVAHQRRFLSSLSGGERQRTVIARALAQACPVLVLDEATARLNLGYQQEVLDLIARLCREKQLTVVSTMHDLTLASAYSDELVLVLVLVLVAGGSSRADRSRRRARPRTSRSSPARASASSTRAVRRSPCRFPQPPRSAETAAAHRRSCRVVPAAT